MAAPPRIGAPPTQPPVDIEEPEPQTRRLPPMLTEMRVQEPELPVKEDRHYVDDTPETDMYETPIEPISSHIPTSKHVYNPPLPPIPSQQPESDAEALYEEPPITESYPDAYPDANEHYSQPEGEATYESVPEPQLNPPLKSDDKEVDGLNARAIFDYEANDDDELTFDVDAIITNIEQIDDGWWFGEYNGARGLFPANYVELI